MRALNTQSNGLRIDVFVALRGQAGQGIKTKRLIWRWHQRNTQQGYETRVLQKEAFEFFGLTAGFR